MRSCIIVFACAVTVGGQGRCAGQCGSSELTRGRAQHTPCAHQGVRGGGVNRAVSVSHFCRFSICRYGRLGGHSVSAVLHVCKCRRVASAHGLLRLAVSIGLCALKSLLCACLWHPWRYFPVRCASLYMLLDRMHTSMLLKVWEGRHC